jgi:hypothetical protein
METTPTHTTYVRWGRPKELLAAGFVVAFAMFQLIVPMLKLTEPRLARFGWQMFAGRGSPRAQFTVILADGSAVSTVPRIPVRRPEVPYEEIVPPQLCRHIPDARSVWVSVWTSTWEFRCP